MLKDLNGLIEVIAMLKDFNGRIWVTVKEAAEMLQVSPSRLVKAAKEGKIDAKRLSARAMLVDLDQARYWRERFYSARKAEVARQRKRKERETTQQ
jgi:excisionase family DNA binding protein